LLIKATESLRENSKLVILITIGLRGGYKLVKQIAGELKELSKLAINVTEEFKIGYIFNRTHFDGL